MTLAKIASKMERSPQDKGLFGKSALSCGEDPSRQCCELQAERANDRTADDPASNAACEKNEFHEVPPEMKKGHPSLCGGDAPAGVETSGNDFEGSLCRVAGIVVDPVAAQIRRYVVLPPIR